MVWCANIVKYILNCCPCLDYFNMSASELTKDQLNPLNQGAIHPVCKAFVCWKYPECIINYATVR